VVDADLERVALGEQVHRRKLPNLPLEDLLQLVNLYAERGSPKYERAALTEGSPKLQHFAEVTASLAKRDSAQEWL
jgi:hypothetical protein